ncbi:DUF2304 domain-containing protein [Georgenia thermotolerans]|uniref:DUF2304 family protein n=1 Tax=Georgenia thermotolerans TaxID=527326 RepID=A0A7J5UR11_9MICO|nr:DUF2304 domain-containing protein [Georgenia thermotolerans]KAE8764554.1 DUF2304 family protein [Georgenia thermotolerans]
MTLYQLLPVLAALLFAGYLLHLLRARRIREKYVTLWFALGAVVLVLSVLPKIAFRVADLLGFQAPSNMLLACAVLVLLLVSVHLSTAMSSVEEQRRTIAEEVAIARLEIEELRAAIAGDTDRATVAPDTDRATVAPDTDRASIVPDTDRATMAPDTDAARDGDATT